MNNILKTFLWIILTVLLVDLYWVPEFQDYWWHWFGLIGFGLIGWFCYKAFNKE